MMTKSELELMDLIVRYIYWNSGREFVNAKIDEARSADCEEREELRALAESLKEFQGLLKDAVERVRAEGR